jgi:hypothetical protein
VVGFLQDTLAWQQLDHEQIAKWELVAATSFQRYEQTPPERRRRWGRSGTSIPTSVVLEEISDELVSQLSPDDLPQDGAARLGFLLSPEVIQRMLNVSENPKQRGFKPYQSAPRTNLLDVDMQGLVLAWLRGVELDEIASTYLTALTDDDYRADVLSEFVAGVLEHHLPWMLATVIAWINARLDEPAVPTSLPAMLHFGVNTPIAVNLMGNGVAC